MTLEPSAAEAQPAGAQPWASLPRAYGPAPLRAAIKLEPEDFLVEEQLGFVADGQGEHDLLWIEKRGSNSEWLARQLARHAGVAPLAVGYAGSKDRQALTRQAYTVQLPGRQVDWQSLQVEGLRLLSVARHSRKLKRGGLIGNRFRLRLRAVRGDREQALERLQQIAEGGFPNYFGAQRFGRQGANLRRAEALFADPRLRLARVERAFAISAARSALFNAVLAERVRQGSWSRILDGELCNLDRRRAVFGPVEVDATLERRCAEGEIHPSGPLWGRGQPGCGRKPAELETRIAEACAGYARGLEAEGLEQERRALRVIPGDWEVVWPQPEVLELGFSLPAGAYATALLHELLDERPDFDDES